MSGELMESYDVVVIGGGPAGLNGALMLARSRRAVLVVDAGEPRNSPAEGVHGPGVTTASRLPNFSSAVGLR